MSRKTPAAAPRITPFLWFDWRKLSAGGTAQQCGWLKVKFGVSWQIIPSILGELLNDEDAAVSQRAMKAMLQMVKLDIKQLKAAAAGR